MAKVQIGLRFLLAFFFTAAGINHFVNPDFYLNIMPDYIPLHRELVLISGVTEIIAGVMLAFKRTAFWGGIGVIAMLIAFMPVHIHMIVESERYADMASVPSLWARIVFQALFVLWAWWCSVKPFMPSKEAAAAE